MNFIIVRITTYAAEISVLKKITTMIMLKIGLFMMRDNSPNEIKD